MNSGTDEPASPNLERLASKGDLGALLHLNLQAKDLQSQLLIDQALLRAASVFMRHCPPEELEAKLKPLFEGPLVPALLKLGLIERLIKQGQFDLSAQMLRVHGLNDDLVIHGLQLLRERDCLDQLSAFCSLQMPVNIRLAANRMLRPASSAPVHEGTAEIIRHLRQHLHHPQFHYRPPPISPSRLQ